MNIKDVVKEKYGQVAASALSSNDEGVRKVAEAFGYSAEELSSIPSGANKSSLPIAGESYCGTTCCGGTDERASVHEGLTAVLERYDVNDYAASVKVYAVKSRAA